MATIDLTKQEVVDVLAEFEERLPNIGTEFFQPDRSITMFNLSNINVEAQDEDIAAGLGKCVGWFVERHNLSGMRFCEQQHSCQRFESVEMSAMPSLFCLGWKTVRHGFVEAKQ